jgi:hypothetical protein
VSLGTLLHPVSGGTPLNLEWEAVDLFATEGIRLEAPLSEV